MTALFKMPDASAHLLGKDGGCARLSPKQLPLLGGRGFLRRLELLPGSHHRSQHALKLP